MIECLFGSRGSRFHPENQDAFGVKSCSPDTVLLALADGAGSAPDSAVGSATAVAAALESCQHGVLEAFSGATQVLCGNKSQACTLSFVQWCGSRLSVGVVGDSPVAAKIDGTWILFTEQPSSEFINETRFLTSPNNNPLCFEESGDIEAVVLFSDGLSQFLVSGSHAHAPALDGILLRARNNDLVIGDLLAWMDSEFTLADDATLIVAYGE